MIAANIEAAILRLTEGYGRFAKSAENLEDRLSEYQSDQKKLDAKLDEAIARHDHKFADISTTLALLKKDVDELKGRADEARRNRWALAIAILSALLSLASALIVAFVKRP